MIEVDGELISRPYVEITLALLARFGIDVVRDGWQRFTVPPRQPLPQPGDDPRRRRRIVGVVFHRRRRDRGDAGAPLRIEGVGSDSIQGDIRFVDAAQAMGAVVGGGPGWLQVHRGRWPLAAITIDCTAIPDAAMTLAVMALYADGAEPADRHRELARQGNRPHRRDGRRTAQGRRAVVDRRRLHRRHAAAALAAGRDRDLRRPPHRDVPVAGGVQPAGRGPHGAGVPVRIEDPRCVGKTFPDYFETLFAVAPPTPTTVPVITIDGPTASGKGTLASAVAAALGWHLLDSGALYRAAGLAASWDGVSADDEAALARLAAALDLRFDGGRTWLRGREVTDELRLEATGLLASRVSAHPAVRRRAARRAAGVPPRARAGRRRPRHGHRRLPARGAQGLPHRQPRRTRRAAT